MNVRYPGRRHEAREPGGPIDGFRPRRSLFPAPVSVARRRSATRSSTSTSIAISSRSVLRGQGRARRGLRRGVRRGDPGAVARNVVGVDSSPEAIAHAATTYGAEHVTSSRPTRRRSPRALVRGTVVCFETLEHLSDHDRLLGRSPGSSGPTASCSSPRPTARPISRRGVEPLPLARGGRARARRPARSAISRTSARRPAAGSSSAIVPRAERGGAAYFDRRRGPLRVVGRSGRPVYLIALGSTAKLPRRVERAARPEYLPALHAAYPTS